MGFGLNSGTLLFVDLRRCVSDDVPPCTSPKENVQLILEFLKLNGCVWSLILEKHTKPYTLNLKISPWKKRFLYEKTIIFQIPCQTSGVYISENVSFQGLLDVDSLSVENIEILLESQ